MSAPFAFPENITSLPLVDLPIPGVKAYLLQGTASQSVFFDIPGGFHIPPHSHGTQWGIVIDGEIEMTIGDKTQMRKKGDSYHIPAGVVHSATAAAPCRVLDVFFDPDRYKAKK